MTKEQILKIIDFILKFLTSLFLISTAAFYLSIGFLGQETIASKYYSMVSALLLIVLAYKNYKKPLI